MTSMCPQCSLEFRFGFGSSETKGVCNNCFQKNKRNISKTHLNHEISHDNTHKRETDTSILISHLQHINTLLKTEIHEANAAIDVLKKSSEETSKIIRELLSVHKNEVDSLKAQLQFQIEVQHATKKLVSKPPAYSEN
jgi:hypothetical protein